MNNIIQDDCLNHLKTMKKNSIHLIVTSPPYFNAKEYSHYESYEEYLNILKKIFIECFNVLEDGRFCVVNTSNVLVPRISRQHQSQRLPIPYDLNKIMQDIGFEFIDDIIWVKPEPSVKNRNASFSQHKTPLAYKPNAITENIMVYRKKTTKLIDWNIRKYPLDIKEKSLIEEFETTNVWYIHPTKNKNHPAPFPLILAENIIRYYSFVGDIILDPFAGSGTTGVAAKKLNRNYYLIEKNENYIKIMLKLLNN